MVEGYAAKVRAREIECEVLSEEQYRARREAVFTALDRLADPLGRLADYTSAEFRRRWHRIVSWPSRYILGEMRTAVVEC